MKKTLLIASLFLAVFSTAYAAEPTATKANDQAIVGVYPGDTVRIGQERLIRVDTVASRADGTKIYLHREQIPQNMLSGTK